MKMEGGLQTLEEVAESVQVSVEEAERMLSMMCKDGLVYRVKDRDGVGDGEIFLVTPSMLTLSLR